jgi:hypothetical protein
MAGEPRRCADANVVANPMSHATLLCPVCESPVDVTAASIGELLECVSCHARFRVDLRPGPDKKTWVSVCVPAAAVDEVSRDIALRFEVLGVLGRGGQGAVWRVRPRGSAREFALKFLDSASIATSGFNAEHELAGLLAHPNIVSLHAIGSSGAERPYAVYEIVEGSTLRALTTAGPLPLGRAIDLAIQVLRGLAYSHRRGIVHRDIKPENVLVTGTGLAKITDFGIGRMVGTSNELPARATPESFVGTPAYAPPEQLQGQGVVRASDMYSFGAVLYELLAGRRPFVAPSLEILVHHQINTMPQPPSHYRPDLPKPLVDFVMDCLKKRPADRPADGTQGLRRLSAICAALEIPVPLELEPATMRPATLASEAGWRLARGRVGVTVLALGLPLVFLGLQLGCPALLAWPLTAPLAAVLAALAAAGTANVAMGRTWWDFELAAEDGSTAVRGVVAVLLGLATLLVGALLGPFTSHASGMVGLLVLREILVVGLVWVIAAPTLVVWVQEALARPVEELARRTDALIELGSLRTMTASLDGGPIFQVPARVYVPPGEHALVVAHAGKRTAFLMRVLTPGLQKASFYVAKERPLQDTRGADRDGRDGRETGADAMDTSPVVLLLASLACGIALGAPATLFGSLLPAGWLSARGGPGVATASPRSSPAPLFLAAARQRPSPPPPRPRMLAPLKAPKPPTATETRAWELSEKAIELMGKHLYMEAEALFRQSLTLQDSVMTRRSLAEALAWQRRFQDGKRELVAARLPILEILDWELEKRQAVAKLRVEQLQVYLWTMDYLAFNHRQNVQGHVQTDIDRRRTHAAFRLLMHELKYTGPGDPKRTMVDIVLKHYLVGPYANERAGFQAAADVGTVAAYDDWLESFERRTGNR